MRIVIGLVVIAVIGFFSYRMYQDKATQEAVQQAAQQATQQAEAAAKQAADAAAAAADQAKQAAGQAAQAAGDAAQKTASLVVGGVDIGAELKGLVESASTTLGSVTDQATAQAAVPSLTELKGKVDGIAGQVDQLPVEGKKLLAGVVSTALPALKELAVKVSSIQSAESIKPAIDAVIAKLETWANTPA